MKVMVWDFNGVIVDDAEGHRQAFNAILAAFNKPTIPNLDALRKTTTVPYIKSLENIGISQDEFMARVHEIDPKYHQVYLASGFATRVRDGLHDVLDTVTSLGGVNIILTNTRPDAIQHQLALMGLFKRFNWISSADNRNDIATKLNKQERLEKFLNDNQVTDAFIIGDSTEEPEVARKLGLTSIAINGGWFDTERLVNARPNHHVNSLREVPAILQAAWQRPKQKIA